MMDGKLFRIRRLLRRPRSRYRAVTSAGGKGLGKVVGKSRTRTVSKQYWRTCSGTDAGKCWDGASATASAAVT